GQNFRTLAGARLLIQANTPYATPAAARVESGAMYPRKNQSAPSTRIEMQIALKRAMNFVSGSPNIRVRKLPSTAFAASGAPPAATSGAECSESVATSPIPVIGRLMTGSILKTFWHEPQRTVLP